MSTEPLRCAGALIFDDHGRLFVQRRSPDRRLFPNAWDCVGGHVEPGETLEETLRREVTEETGWQVTRILGIAGEYRWTGDDGLARIETDFLVEVAGDLANPRLEPGRHTEFRWLTRDEAGLVAKDPDPTDGLMLRIVTDAFAALDAIGR